MKRITIVGLGAIVVSIAAALVIYLAAIVCIDGPTNVAHAIRHIGLVEWAKTLFVRATYSKEEGKAPDVSLDKALEHVYAVNLTSRAVSPDGKIDPQYIDPWGNPTRLEFTSLVWAETNRDWVRVGSVRGWVSIGTVSNENCMAMIALRYDNDANLVETNFCRKIGEPFNLARELSRQYGIHDLSNSAARTPSTYAVDTTKPDQLE